MIEAVTAPAPFQWGQIITIMIPIFATSALGVFAWSVRRILARIDSIGVELIKLRTDVTVIQTKQDLAVETSLRTDRVTRKTARKVGVRLPADLENTIDPRRVVHG